MLMLMLTFQMKTALVNCSQNVIDENYVLGLIYNITYMTAY